MLFSICYQFCTYIFFIIFATLFFFLSLFTVFVLKSILSDMSIATPAFFWSLFPWKIFFQPFTFSLYVSPVLRWVSCRQHMQGSCFCIHFLHQVTCISSLTPLYSTQLCEFLCVPDGGEHLRN